MSDLVEQCPTCGGAVEREETDIGERLKATMSLGQLALAMDNEAVAVGLAKVFSFETRLAIASVMLQSEGEPFFTPDDVREEAEAAARCDGVVKQLRARRQFDDAVTWSMMAEKHRKRAKRIMLLLSNTEQQMLQQQIHAGPLGDPPRSPIEVVKS